VGDARLAHASVEWIQDPEGKRVLQVDGEGHAAQEYLQVNTDTSGRRLSNCACSVHGSNSNKTMSL
jgi:hypothetical protein